MKSVGKVAYQSAYVNQDVSQFKKRPINFMLNRIIPLPKWNPRIDNTDMDLN